MLDVIKILAMTLLLLPSVFAQDALSQQKSAGIGLFKTGQQMMQQATSTKDLEKAAEKFLEALQSFEKDGFLKGQGAACDYIAVICEQLGKSGESLKYHKKALEIKTSTADLVGQANTLNNLSMLQIKMKNYSDAEKSLNKALKIRERNNDRKSAAQIEMNLGRVHFLMGHNDKALINLGKAIATSRTNNDTETFAMSLLHRGNTRFVLEDYAEAQKDFQEALKNAGNVKDPQFRMQAQWGLGRVLAEQGHFKEASGKLEEALRQAERSNREVAAQILRDIARTALDSGQFNKAHDSANKSLTLFKEMGNQAGVAEALNTIGNLYLDQGQYAKAVLNYQQGKQIADQCGYRRIEARTLHNLASAYMDSGDFKLAKQNLDAALKINEAIPDVTGQAKNLASLANMYHAQGLYKPAEKSYLTAIEKLKQKDDYRYQSRLFNNLGAIYQDQGEFDSAEEQYKKSLKISQDAKSEIPRDRIWDNLANLYMDKMSMDIDWESKAKKNVSKLEQSDLYKSKGGANSAVGRFYYLTGNNSKAESYYRALLAAAERSGDIDDLVAAFTGLGLVHEARQNFTDAEDYFQKAIDETENIKRSLSPSERPEFFNVKSRGFRRVAPYKGLARVQIKMGKSEKAFETSEHTKARRFAEEIAGRSAMSDLGLPEKIKEEDKRLNELRMSAYRSLLKARRSGTPESTRECRIKVDEMDRQLKEHRMSLLDSTDWRINLFALTSYPGPLPLDKMALKDNEWVLAYDVTDAGIIIYVCRGQQIKGSFFKKLSRDDLNQMINTFRQPMDLKAKVRERCNEFEFRTGKRLGDLLLADALMLIPENDPITIVPDGLLSLMPFEMLLLNSEGKVRWHPDRKVDVDGAHFFGERNQISYTPSITAQTLARTIVIKREKPKDSFLVVVDPVFGSEDERLAPESIAKDEVMAQSRTMATIEESENLILPPKGPKRLESTNRLADTLEKMHGPDCVSVRGFEANRAKLLSQYAPNLNQSKIIVFATHGNFSGGRLEPYILLSMVSPTTPPRAIDGVLKMSDILGLQMNADLIALTACQTGLGKEQSGEGVMSMGRAFQYAGAKSVLMTLWEVEEESAVLLTENFFQYLNQGKTKLQALQAAREAIRKAGYDHPYFWSGFILVGETS